MNVGCDAKMFCTKELRLNRNPEIPLVKTLNQEIPLASVFQGIWVRDKSNIRLHDLGIVTVAEGCERMYTKIVLQSTLL